MGSAACWCQRQHRAWAAWAAMGVAFFSSVCPAEGVGSDVVKELQSRSKELGLTDQVVEVLVPLAEGGEFADVEALLSYAVKQELVTDDVLSLWVKLTEHEVRLLSAADPGPNAAGVINDVCTGAITVAVPSMTMDTTVGMTVDTVPQCSVCASAPGVWFKVVGTGNRITADTCAATGYDSKISVFTGTCGALTCVDGNDDMGAACVSSTLRSRVRWCSAMGTDYFILVHGFATATGAFTLNISEAMTACAPPPNDQCAAAVNLAGMLPFTDPAVNYAEAHDDNDTSCNATGTTCTLTVTRRGVWYTYTPPGNRILTVASTPTTGVVRGLFTGANCGALTQVAVNGCSTTSPSNFTLVGGTQYWILVGHSDAFTEPTTTLSVTFSEVLPPANDVCADAPLLAVPSMTAGTTVNASSDSAPTCTVSNTQPGVWYRVLGTGNTITADTCAAGGAGTLADTRISVFCGGCPCNFCVAGNDNATPSCVGFTSRARVSWCSAMGQEYHILVHQGTATAGTFRLDLTDNGLGCPPTADCSAATNDDCGMAESVSDGLIVRSNADACLDMVEASCQANSNKDVWFSYMASCTGTLSIDTEHLPMAPPATALSDTVVSVYDACGGMQLACDDDSGVTPELSSRLTLGVTMNTVYLIRVAGFGANSGNFNLDISCSGNMGACCLAGGSCSVQTLAGCNAMMGAYQGDFTVCMPNPCPQPPANDLCTMAEAMGPLPDTVMGNNSLGNDDPETAAFCGTSVTFNQPIWYTVVGTGNDLRATTCLPGTDHDTVIKVYCNDCGALSCVTGNDDQGGAFDLACETVLEPGINRKSTVTWCSEAGETYFIAVGSFLTFEGAIEMSVTDLMTGCVPMQSCDPAACGNGFIDMGEQCDDGNVMAGDGCSATCMLENDPCAMPTIIPSVPYMTTVNNDTATADGPAGSCNVGGATTMQNSIWYSFTPADDCQATLTVDVPVFYDLITVVWEGSDCMNLTTEIDCADAEPNVISWAAMMGTTYLFQIGDWGTFEGGGLTTIELTCPTLGACCDMGVCTATDAVGCAGTFLGLGTVCDPDTCTPGACCAPNGSCTEIFEDLCADNFLGVGTSCMPNVCPQPPANDECVNNVPLAVPSLGVMGTNVNATTETLPTCDVFSGPNLAVWYSVIGTGNTITASLCASTATTYDTVLGVYCNDCPLLLCVDEDDDSCGTFAGPSRVTWCSEMGRRYFIAVGTFGSEPADVFTLDVTDSGMACSPAPNCNPPMCGNSLVEVGEQCDDGNMMDDDGCDSMCQLECGNNMLDGAEQCDDGNTISCDGCSSTCLLEACGDGDICAPEECDDGNTMDDDGCDSMCLLECGNGMLDGAEQCDDGNTVSCDGCSATCVLESCGDGVICAPELCDDSNTMNGDGCDSMCLLEAHPNDLCDMAEPVAVPSMTVGTTTGGTFDMAPFCGTSNDAGTEGLWYSVMGTGNTLTVTTCNPVTNYDSKLTVYCLGCPTLNCVGGNDDTLGAPPACALGPVNRKSTVTWCSQMSVEYLILVHGFSGLDGSFRMDVSDNGMACVGAVTCTPPVCGNGMVESGETCDDGNTMDDDGCDALCQVECGNGMLDGAEECDDGNTVSCDGCTATCLLESCGDGVICPSEECDDGNNVNGDGCDSMCLCEALTNDACAMRILVGVGVYSFCTTGATTDGPVGSFTDPPCAPNFGVVNVANDVWFNFRANCDGLVTIDLSGSVRTGTTTLFDTRIEIYEGLACPPLPPPIACDDDDGTGLNSFVQFAALAGQSYKIRVGSFSALVTGSVIMAISDTCPTGCVDDAACDDAQLCTAEYCDLLTPGCVGKPIRYADVNNDVFVNVGDVLCELDTFAGSVLAVGSCNIAAAQQGPCNPPTFCLADAACPMSNSCNLGGMTCNPCAPGRVCLGGTCYPIAKLDIAPCPAPDANNMGDGFVNVGEVLAVLDTFAGNTLAPTFPCVVACPGPGPASNGEGTDPADVAVPTPMASFAPQAGEASARLTLVPSRRVLRAGEAVTVDVFVSGADDLRAYQVALEALALRGGSLAVESIDINATRADAVFGETSTYWAINEDEGRMLNTLPSGGVDATASRYLATFTFRASADAIGPVRLALRPAETLLRNAASKPVSFNVTESVIVVTRVRN